MKHTLQNNPNLQTFCQIGGLCLADQEALKSLKPELEPHLAEVTDRFYEVLQSDAQTAPYLEGRLEQLKKTHLNWILDIIGGVYDQAFIERQKKIGELHVKVRVPPLFVAASMSHLRSALPRMIHKVAATPEQALLGIKAVIEILDFCHHLIDEQYQETLMDNLGISPALLKRLQTLA